MTTIRDVIAGEVSSQPSDAHAFASMQLQACLEENGAIVTWLHGAIGSGKSKVLSTFETAAREAAAAVVRIDCRNVEPTPSGLMAALCASTTRSTDDIRGLATR